MTAQDLLTWLRAQPFQPFRITMSSGRTLDVRHPEMVRVTFSTLAYFVPSKEEGVFERWEAIGLGLIEHIAPLESASPKPGGQPGHN